MMTIHDLFLRPIDRNINGVIKVGQQDEANVTQELEEYVVTRELDREFNRFFSRYSDALGSETDKVGVWISGFFGSGKSHFLKILSYLLANRDINGTRAADFFDEAKIPDALVRANIERVARAAEKTDVILFNIDAKADAESKTNKEAVVKVMQKAFDEHLGYLASSPEMAAFERLLDKRGHYAAFKDAFQTRSGKPWVQERDGWAFFQGEITAALGEAAGLSENEAIRLIESLNVKQGVSAEEFATEVRDYLNRRGPGHRVVFMIDEVGQYIGDNSSLMLNLQSVTEELGTRAPGRAWVMVTSQEDIDSVLGGRSKNNDFSKIQGRFNTRISLSSANTDEVIRLRLLNKTPDAERALEALYDAQQATLKNLISFSSDNVALPSFSSAHSFVSTYPFVPYQFLLLQKAFTAIRTTGHSGKHLAEGERSMLNAFQDAANQYGAFPLGTLVPFHAFYGPVEGFLDSSVRRVIDQARSNPALESHDIDLLKTLFMVKYVKEIKTNLENLVTLSLGSVDEDRLALRARLQGALERLEKQTLISRSGDSYVFLTHEEQDVGREIKNVEVDAGELNSELQSRVWDSVYPVKTLKYDGYHSYAFNRKLDDRLFGASSGDIGLHLITPYADRYPELREEQNALMASGGGLEALVILPDDTLLFSELAEMVRTEKYLRRKSGADASPSMQSIMHARAEQNAGRKERVETNLRKAITDARVYANGARLPSGASEPREVLTLALRTLVDNGYQKLRYIVKSYQTEADVARALSTADDGQDLDGNAPNHLALEELERFLTDQSLRSVRVTVRSLLENFGHRPFGWSEAELLGVLAALVVRGTAELRRAQGPVNPGEKGLAATLMKKSAQDEITVRLSEVIDPVALNAARELAREAFDGAAVPSEAPKLATEFRERLRQDQTDLTHYEAQAAAGYPFGPLLPPAAQTVKTLLSAEGTAAFFAAVKSHREALEDWYDLRTKLRAFYKGQQLGIFDATRRDLTELGPDLGRVADPGLLAKVSRAQEVMAKDDPTRDIPSIAGLLGPVREHIAGLLVEVKTQVEALWKAEVTRLMSIAQELGPDETKALTGPFLAVKGDLERAATIDAADATQLRVQLSGKEVERAILARINELAQVVVTPPVQVTGTPVLEDGNQPVVVLPPVVPAPRPIRTVTARKAVANQKPYIETAQDIEDFLGELRRELEGAVRKGERVRIE